MVNGKVTLLKKTVAIPNVCETYYSACAAVDRHNICRQQDLNLEKKFRTKRWSLRVNTSILAMVIVDSWLLYKGYHDGRAHMDPWHFYSQLGDELVDNVVDGASTRRLSASSANEDVDPFADIATGTGIRLIPTTRKRKRADGTLTNALYQQQCRICKVRAHKSRHICSECKATSGKDVYVCYHDTKRSCFRRHLAEAHNIGSE